MNRLAFGKTGENIAADYLKSHGFKIIKRNFRCRLGEIDIIAQKGSDIYFIEVKTRQNDHFGTPFESITPKKQQQIIKTAKFYITKSKKEANYHFSAIGIILGNDDQFSVNFLENAFETS